MARQKSDSDGEGPSAPPADGSAPAPDDSLAQQDTGAAPPDTSPAEAALPEPEPLPPLTAASPPAPDPVDMPEPAPAPDPVPPIHAGHPPRQEAPEAEPEPALPDEPGEEDEGHSFAGRALAGLLLLLAGAGIGIWAAPRIAPALPSGMAPVAAWLTPGTGEAEARLEALEARLDARLAATEAAVSALPATDDLEARIGAAVTEATGSATADITALRQEIDAQDPTALRQRLDALASALDGQGAELDTLKDQLAGGVAAGSSASDEAIARIDVYRAELEGLRAEVTSLGSQTSALAARIDEVAATADRSIETAQARVATIEADASDALDAAHTASDMALLRAALAAGQPFADVAERLAASAPLPEGITAAAASGAPTLAALRERFPEAAHAAIRASIIASAGEGIVARTGAFLSAQVASRSLTPQPGMTPDAILSRMEDRLENGDLASALAEAENLPSEATAAMAGWLASARLRLAADTGLSALSAPAPAPAVD